MPTYDGARFRPPAPFALVSVRNLGDGAVAHDVPMLLDTGADVTLLPRPTTQQLGIEPIPNRRYELVAFDGGASFAPVVRLELVFLGRSFRGQFLVIEQDWGILGRNVLNSVRLLLDGPRLQWGESRSP